MLRTCREFEDCKHLLKDGRSALMKPSPRQASLEPRAAARGRDSVPDLIVFACILFNFALCFVDTNIVALGPVHVMAAEAAILGFAFFTPFIFGTRQIERMDYLLFALLINWVFLSIFRQTLNPKLFRDVAIMPIFIMLGQASRGVTFHKRMYALHVTILLFALWEAVSLSTFVSFFSVADFFAHTRGLQNDDWWINNGLFISSVRPESRFLFPSLPVHRLSSVFLEPVSLGNYVIIATIWLAASWREMPNWIRWSAILINTLLLVGSDSRMATMTCLVILVAACFRRRIPRYAAVPIAPVVVALMFGSVAILGLEKGQDDFGGRLAYSVQVFQDFGVEDYFGVSLAKMKAVEDAGFAYLVISQSIVIVVVLWAAIFVKGLSTPNARFVYFAVATYLALNLTVSWALFSIKTAALLWFLLGRANREDADLAVSATDIGKAIASPATSDRQLITQPPLSSNNKHDWNRLQIRWEP